MDRAYKISETPEMFGKFVEKLYTKPTEVEY